MKIGVVNYSIGNVGSVYSALKFYSYDVFLPGSPAELKKADYIVLAGVGSFPTAKERLKELGLWDALNEEVMTKKKPVLGICLGMQLFADTSSEGGENSGFGWIKGKVVKLKGDGIRIPHMGWNEVTARDKKLFNGMRYGSFYFMHSYQMIPDDKKTIAATTGYGDLEIVSAVRKDNILGVQFHPEKSQGDGLRFLRNAIEANI